MSLDGISEDDFCFLAGGESLLSFLSLVGANILAPVLMRHFSNSLLGFKNLTFSDRKELWGASDSRTRSNVNTT